MNGRDDRDDKRAGPPAPPRRGYAKSDGFTTDRPRLPSVDAPDARPRPLASGPAPISGSLPARTPSGSQPARTPSGSQPARTPSGSQPARTPLQPRPAPRRGGYSSGDGMTSDKPRLPSQDQSSAADLKPDRPEGLRVWGASLVDSSRKPPPKR